MSIFGSLKRLGKSLSFHTPGHAGALNALDSTEIPFVFPTNEIGLAEQKAAQFYKAKAVRFLVNGSSIGVKSMILSAGGDVIAPKDRHRAVDEGAELARVKLIEVENEVKDDLPLPLSAEQIEKAYRTNPNAKAVLVQSPDYYGQTADLVSIRRTCDKLGLLMLIDSAHGAHFISDSEIFPLSASVIADATNMSAHKTMRAYTQSAFLAVNNERLLPEIDRNLTLLGTTSPSYILLGQLEKAVEFEQGNRSKYAKLIKEINEIKNAIPTLNNDDVTRLVVDAKKMGLSGEQLYRELAEKQIYAEKYDSRYVVFIIMLSHTTIQIKRLKMELIRLWKKVN